MHLVPLTRKETGWCPQRLTNACSFSFHNFQVLLTSYSFPRRHHKIYKILDFLWKPVNLVLEWVNLSHIYMLDQFNFRNYVISVSGLTPPSSRWKPKWIRSAGGSNYISQQLWHSGGQQMVQMLQFCLERFKFSTQVE